MNLFIISRFLSRCEKMGGGGMLVGGPEFWQSVEILSHDPNLFVTSTLS
jgi:hypothetical protein